MPTSRLRSRVLALLVALLLIVPAGVRADTASAQVAVVAPVVQSTFTELGQPPLTVTVSRIIFTPGA
ncbi:MAG TPA: hypothetical protein VH482_01395, partial [Thermomicrobiales bacterium]